MPAVEELEEEEEAVVVPAADPLTCTTTKTMNLIVDDQIKRVDRTMLLEAQGGSVCIRSKPSVKNDPSTHHSSTRRQHRR